MKQKKTCKECLNKIFIKLNRKLTENRAIEQSYTISYSVRTMEDQTILVLSIPEHSFKIDSFI